MNTINEISYKATPSSASTLSSIYGPYINWINFGKDLTLKPGESYEVINTLDNTDYTLHMTLKGLGNNNLKSTALPLFSGNLGIAVGEQFHYAKVDVDGKIYIVANDLVDSLASEFGWENYKVVEVISGTSFDGVKYKHIFMDRVSPVVIGFHVTLDAGTGLVHIAPGYGADDFVIGKQFDLGLINGVNDQGILTEESGEFAGLFFEDANKAVVQKLEDLGVLLKLKFTPSPI